MDKEILLEWYRQMVLIRRFEERSDELYQLEGKIKGFLHLYIGQEAIAVGIRLPNVSDDEIKLNITLKSGAEFDPVEFSHCIHLNSFRPDLIIFALYTKFCF